MKNIIKSTFPIVLVIVLFCAAAFADGDMSNGGKTCTGGTCPGFAAQSADSSDDVIRTAEAAPVTENGNSVLIFMNEFLEGIGII